MDIDSINFLPQVYQRRLAERQRRWRLTVLLVLLGVGLATWSLSQRSYTADLRDEAALYDQQVDAARQQMQLVGQLRAKHTELTNRLALWHRLDQPVSHGQVFATLAGELPDAVVLIRLEVQSHRSNPVGDSARQSRRSRSSDASTLAAQPSDRLTLDFTGIAPDDMTLANLLNQLKRHRLFEDVKLHFSRSVRVHGTTGRQFRIEMTVPLDRDYQTQPTEEGMADAR